MVIFVPPPAIVHEQPAPPPMANCQYQVKIDIGTWKCLTEQQYLDQQLAEAQRYQAESEWISKHWYIFVGGIVLVIVLGFLMGV